MAAAPSAPRFVLESDLCGEKYTSPRFMPASCRRAPFASIPIPLPCNGSASSFECNRITGNVDLDPSRKIWEHVLAVTNQLQTGLQRGRFAPSVAHQAMSTESATQLAPSSQRRGYYAVAAGLYAANTASCEHNQA